MLKKIFSCASVISIFCSGPAFCMEPEDTKKCGFMARQGAETILSVGDLDTRHSPYSTFKVPLALLAFDSGFFKTPKIPTLPFKEEYEAKLQSWYTPQRGQELHWREDQTPTSYMKNSVIWVSHRITEPLGETDFKKYASVLKYGNENVSGGPLGGLYDSWLGTSLKISPREQVEFLEDLLDDNFPGVSPDAQQKTRIIMRRIIGEEEEEREEDWGEWKLYGKTGGGRDGWFTGWIEKEDHKPIIFAQYLNLDDPDLDLMGVPIQKSVGLTAKEVAKKRLKEFWQEAGDK